MLHILNMHLQFFEGLILDVKSIVIHFYKVGSSLNVLLLIERLTTSTTFKPRAKELSKYGGTIKGFIH